MAGKRRNCLLSTFSWAARCPNLSRRVLWPAMFILCITSVYLYTCTCAGLGSSVGCMLDWWSGGREFAALVRPLSFLETDHEKFSTVILSLLLIQGREVVSYMRKNVHWVLVNCLIGLSLPRKSVVRLTDCPNMTLAVECVHLANNTTTCTCNIMQYSKIPLRPPKIKRLIPPFKSIFKKIQSFFLCVFCTQCLLERDHLWDCSKVVLKNTFEQTQRWSLL